LVQLTLFSSVINSQSFLLKKPEIHKKKVTQTQKEKTEESSEPPKSKKANKKKVTKGGNQEIYVKLVSFFCY
jgi:hypothetical protein